MFSLKSVVPTLDLNNRLRLRLISIVYDKLFDKGGGYYR